MEQWYTLYTKPNAEYQVAKTLGQRGLETYLPELSMPKKHTGRNKKPFFPCYLFIKADWTRVELSSVQWTPGLRRVIVFDDLPAPLTNDMIDVIRYNLGELTTRGEQPQHNFKPGDTVRITDGPFRDLLAIFDGPTTSAGRVQVLLNILGHASRTQVDVADLEKAPRNAEVPHLKRPRRTRGRGRRITNKKWNGN